MFLTLSVWSLFAGFGDVTEAKSRLLAGFPSAATMNTLDSSLKEDRYISKTATRVTQCRPVVAIVIARATGCSHRYRIASRHERKSESVYQKYCRGAF